MRGVPPMIRHINAPRAIRIGRRGHWPASAGWVREWSPGNGRIVGAYLRVGPHLIWTMWRHP